jgi:hypothetical protein
MHTPLPHAACTETPSAALRPEYAEWSCTGISTASGSACLATCNTGFTPSGPGLSVGCTNGAWATISSGSLTCTPTRKYMLPLMLPPCTWPPWPHAALHALLSHDMCVCPTARAVCTSTPGLPLPANAAWSCQGIAMGNTCQAGCLLGFIPQGTGMVAICTNGGWALLTPSTLMCFIRECGVQRICMLNACVLVRRLG